MASDPAWKPDPWRPGRRRWWDGSGWTDDTWEPEELTVDALPSPNGHAAPAQAERSSETDPAGAARAGTGDAEANPDAAEHASGSLGADIEAPLGQADQAGIGAPPRPDGVQSPTQAPPVPGSWAPPSGPAVGWGPPAGPPHGDPPRPPPPGPPPGDRLGHPPAGPPAGWGPPSHGGPTGWGPFPAPQGPPPQGPPPGWGPSPAGGPPPVLDPRIELAAELQAARWAKLAFVVLAVNQLVTALVLVLWYLDWVKDAFDVVEITPAGQEPVLPDMPAPAVADLLTPLALAAMVMLVIWTFRTVRVSRNLHHPNSRTPGWAAAGWLVPVLNFWFPYQGIRDALPTDHPARGRILRWWLLLMAAMVVLPALAGVVGWFSRPIGLVLCLPVGVAAGLAALAGQEVVDDVVEHHRAAIAELTGQSR